MIDFFVYFLLSLPLVGAYGMLAVGIVVVFRASKVLNLAQGAMAMLPAYLVYEANNRGMPIALAVPLGVASGMLLGACVERLFVRPLARQGNTAQTVGTVAVYGLVVAAAAQLWGSGSLQAPSVFPGGGLRVSGSLLTWGQLGLVAVALGSTLACFALFRYTELGLALRGAAENPTAAGLMGINSDRMARIAWMLGGGLAALAGILLAAITNLQPYNLSLQMLPAFVAALIGGLASLPGAAVGAVIVGVAQGMVPAFSLIPGVRRFAGQVGMPQLVLTVIALVAMYVRGNRFSVADSSSSLAADDVARPVHSAYDESVLPKPGGRSLTARLCAVALLLAWPLLGVPSALRPLDTYSVLGDAILMGEYLLVAASIVLLTGWVGQISLAQATFVGISAFSSALLATHLGIKFPFSLPICAAISAGASALLGLVALRVRGLYLAVATLIVAWMADEYLFVVPWFAGKGGSTSVGNQPIGHPDSVPFFDMTDRRTFYYLIVAVSVAVLLGLLNLRDSKTGRAFAALRGSEVAAASLGIDVIRYKLLAFAASGFLAGLAGNLMLTHRVTVVPDQFALRSSLLFLAIAVVGGLRSLGGAVSASALFAMLSELFFRVPALGEYLQLVSAALLAVILLVYPGGLAALPATFRRMGPALSRLARRASGAPLADKAPARGRLGDAIAARLEALMSLIPSGLRRTPAVAMADAVVAVSDSDDLVVEPVAMLPEPEQPRDQSVVDGRVATAIPPAFRSGPRPDPSANAIEAEGITVRFGGLTAVDDVSLVVPTAGIVGLIGPNGAGKTTLFNAISGLNEPTAGAVRLFGEDVTSLPVHQRAQRGLARTFQVLQLFSGLTVFENLLVATHLHNRSNVFSNVFLTGGAVQAEMAAERVCREVVGFLGLEDIADRPVTGLPFGTLRMVEIARALVTGAPALMLDEPASGLDNRETDELSRLLVELRSSLGLSVLLIEHDVRMVTSVSDYIYVVNRGRLLASGPPAAVQRDPAVIAAYLGEPVLETAGA